MKEWLTAREIAEEHLPELGGTERALQMYAEREGWNEHPSFARKRSGRGGGMEYHYRILPTLAQIAYQQRHMRIGIVDLPPAANDEPATESPSSGRPVTGRAALERDARLAIVRKFDKFHSGLTLRQASALQVFTDKYNARSLHIEDWVIDVVPRLSKGSLKRWMQKSRKGDQLGVDRGLARKGTGTLDTANGGAVKTFILGLIAHQPYLSAKHVRMLVRAEFGDRLTVVSKGVETSVPVPDVRGIQRFVAALKAENKVVLLKLTNPDRFRSTMAPSGTGTLRHITEPNALWQIDASPVDALCTDGRHTIYVCIDIATRRKVVSVSLTPRASAVALLIRKAILEWGVPSTIKTDNGSDFTARDTKRLFASLGIEVELSDPYSPQQKGHVERAIGTFQRDLGPTLPGFIGHSVADRVTIESRKSFAQRLGESDADAFCVELSGADLQDVVDRWVSTVYQHRPHAGLQLETPFQRAAKSTKPMRTVDERALDLLLMAVPGGDGRRRTTKFGIRVDGRHYMTPAILPGTDVLVRMDSADLGLVYAFGPDGGEFLGVGICPEYSGISPETAVATIKEMQADIVARGTAEIKAEIRRIKKGPALYERIFEVAARDIPNVVALPKRREEHSTPQIEAAIEAMDAMSDRLRPSDPMDERTAAEHRRLIEEIEQAEIAEDTARHLESVSRHEATVSATRTAHLPPEITAIPESPKERYRRFYRLQQAADDGQPVDPKDLILLGRYQTTAEFKGQADMHEAYGDEYLAF